MRSFLRLWGGIRSSRNLDFFSATSKYYTRDFASNPSPAKVPARRRRPIYLGGFTCCAVPALVLLAYKSDNIVVLNPTSFTPYILTGKDRVSPTSSIFTLQPIFISNNARVYARAWEKGLWSLEVKQPQLQIARSYTPLPPTDGGEFNGALQFLIREEPRGEVSGYLHRLPLGAEIDLRGPHTEYEFSDVPKYVEEVLFIAGGTGIAPALQAAHSLYNCKRNHSLHPLPKIRILWANRRREDAFGITSDSLEISNEPSRGEERSPINVATGARSPSIRFVPSAATWQITLVQQLDTFRATSQDHFSVECFIDEENSFITEDVLRDHLKTQNTEQIYTASRDSGTRLILISGPDGFVKHYTGPKAWKNGKEVQGPVGGVLKNLNTEGWVVHKL